MDTDRNRVGPPISWVDTLSLGNKEEQIV
jgi:hypothetical protein